MYKCMFTLSSMYSIVYSIGYSASNKYEKEVYGD
jgi:hypothetical protein